MIKKVTPAALLSRVLQVVQAMPLRTHRCLHFQRLRIVMRTTSLVSFLPFHFLMVSLILCNISDDDFDHASYGGSSDSSESEDSDDGDPADNPTIEEIGMVSIFLFVFD